MAGARITDRNDWFTIWEEDRRWIHATMLENLASDLNNGYSEQGNSVKKQRADIDAYEARTDECYEMFKKMTDIEVNRWCFYDLKKRGAIE